MSERAEPTTKAASTAATGQIVVAQAGTSTVAEAPNAAAPAHPAVEVVPPPSPGELVTIHAAAR